MERRRACAVCPEKLVGNKCALRKLILMNQGFDDSPSPVA